MCNVLIVDVEVFGWEEEVANVNGLDNIGGGGILHSPRLLLLPVGGFVTGRFCQSLLTTIRTYTQTTTHKKPALTIHNDEK